MTQQKEYSKLYNSLFKYYTAKALPVLRRYDKERKEIFEKSVVLGIILELLGIGLMALCLYLQIESDNLKPFIAIIITLIILPFYMYINNKKDFERKIKRKIMPALCECLGDMTWKSGYGRIYEDKIINSELVKKFDVSEYDDFFIGTYKDVPIKIIEASYKIKDKKDKDREGGMTFTNFMGIIIKININKKIKCHTVIRPNKIGAGRPKMDLKRTKLEDPVFEKKYNVYTNDEVEARYLITTSFMERLTNIQKIFKAKDVSCAFYKGNLFIALNCLKDMFALCALHKPLYNYEQFDTFYKEIISIYKMIDYFKLNEKTGL